MLELAAFAVTIIIAVTCLYFMYLMHGSTMDALEEMRELIAHLRQNIKPAPYHQEPPDGKIKALVSSTKPKGFADRIG